MDHSHSGSIGICTQSAWINEETVEFWKDHLLKSVRPKNYPLPVLLLFDSHNSHTLNFNVVLKACDNNVILTRLANHCTWYRLYQHYDDTCCKWLPEHPCDKMNKWRMDSWTVHSWKRATVMFGIPKQRQHDLYIWTFKIAALCKVKNSSGISGNWTHLVLSR